MKQILELEFRLNTRLVTPEFEVLAWLYIAGATKSRELAMRTKTSIANFQLILRRLRDNGMIVSGDDAQDKRMRVYDLSAEARACFEQALGDRNAIGFTRLGVAGDRSADFGPTGQSIEAAAG